MKYLKSSDIQEMAFQIEYATDYYVKEICHADHHVSYALIHPRYNVLEYVLVLVYNYAENKMHLVKFERIIASPAGDYKVNRKIEHAMEIINERVHI